MISGYKIQHYYLQFVYSFVLLATIGLLFLIDLFQNSRRVFWIVLGGFILSQAILDWESWRLYGQRLWVSPGRVNVGPISRRLADEPGDQMTLWVNLADNSRYYSETGLLSPVKHLYVIDHLFLNTWQSTGEEKRKQLLADLQTHPPTYIVTSEGSIAHLHNLKLSPVVEWFQAHYEPIPFLRDQDNLLYQYQSNSLDEIQR